MNIHEKKLSKIIANAVIYIVLICFTCSLVYCVINLCAWKNSKNEYRHFYEKSDDFDVLFFGASVVHYAVYPMQLWNDYGITSYNMANDSERLRMTYYNMLNALDYANPKLVMVDLTGIGWAGALRDGTLKDHAFLDSVPLSKNKLVEINAIFDKSERLEYIFPFELYHSRWRELEDKDFYFNTSSTEYGATRYAGIIPFEAPNPSMYEESRESDVFAEYDTVKNMIELCRSRNIDIIFTYFPSAHRGGDQKNRELCAQMMSEFDVDYYDFLYLDFINWGCDTVEGAHLNYYGGQKLTDYLGNMLSEKYGISDRRTDDTIADSWNKDYKIFSDELDIFIDETIEEYNEALANTEVN